MLVQNTPLLRCISAPCALANPDLILESTRVSKRLLSQIRAAEVKDNNGASSNALHTACAAASFSLSLAETVN